MTKKEHKEETEKKNKIIDKIDMDNGNYPYAKDIGRTLAKTTLSGSHRAIIDCILDMTYGWYDPKSEKVQKLKKRKIKELITYRNFENFTGITNKNLSKYILDLVNWKVIKRSKKGQKYLYNLNVNVNEWNKGIFKETTLRVEGSLNYLTGRRRTTLRVEGSLPYNHKVVAESKTNENVNVNKGLQGAEKFPKETITTTYIKNEEKDDIKIKELQEKKEKEIGEIFNCWNEQKILDHKTQNFFIKDIEEALKKYSLEQIKTAISNYAYIFKNKEYYYDFTFTLSYFLESKNIEKFLDLEIAKNNYRLKNINKNNSQDNEDYNIPQYQPEPVKETDEERKVRYEESAKKIRGLIKELKK